MRVDFTQMSVDELRNLLIEKSGITIEEANSIKPKSAVVAKLMEYYETPEPPSVNIQANKNVFDFAEIQTAELEKKLDVERGSPEWQDWVLSLLRSDEYFEKEGKRYPRVAGLRRLTEQLLGPILESGPVQIFPPTGLGKTFATVAFKIRVVTTQGIREYTEVADGGIGNVPDEFLPHPTATAASRAAGRAFRSALLLSIYTAEEMNSHNEVTGPTDDLRILEGAISAAQQISIKNMCSRIGLNLDATLSHHGFDKLDTLTKEQARNFMSVITQYSSDALSIPETIKEPT